MSQPTCWHCVAGVQLFKQCPNLSADTVLQGCSCLSGIGTYLPGTVLQGCSCLSSVTTYLPALYCRVQLFKRCQNLSAGTVLQGCSCLSGVATYLPTLCCRDAAVKVVWKPICQHCVAGVQLFKQCRNLSAGTVLQGCSLLSSVPTYLSALCCRVAAVKVVSKPIYLHCVAEVKLFKLCQNLPAGSVLQRCSCLSSVEPICWHCVAGVKLFKRCQNTICQNCAAGRLLFKWCRNLSTNTVLQECSCLSGVETYLPALCCRAAAV